MKINKENIEELILLFVDGELSEQEAGQLMDFIGQHPGYESLLKSFETTRLTPGEAPIFPAKTSLLREENKIIPFYRSTGFKTRAAAVLVLGILGIAFLWKTDKVPAPPLGVIIQQPLSADRHKMPEALPEKKGDKNKPLVGSMAASKPKMNNAPAVSRLKKKRQPTLPKITRDLPAMQEEIAEQAALRPPLAQTPETEDSELLALNDPPGGAPPVNGTNKEPLRLPDWALADQDRLQGLNDLIGRIQTTRGKVEERVAILKHSTLVLQVWKKEIVFGRENK